MKLVKIYTVYQGNTVQWSSVDPDAVECIESAQIMCEGVWRPGCEITMRSGKTFKSPANASQVEQALRDGQNLAPPSFVAQQQQPTYGMYPAAPAPGALPAPGMAIPPLPPADGFVAMPVATVVDANTPFALPPIGA